MTSVRAGRAPIEDFAYTVAAIILLPSLWTLLAEATRLETASLDAAVKAGTMTEAQRTERLSTMQTRLNDQLTETHAFGSGGGQGNGGGQGYRGGQGSGGSCGGGSGTCQAGTSATT